MRAPAFAPTASSATHADDLDLDDVLVGDLATYRVKKLVVVAGHDQPSRG